MRSSLRRSVALLVVGSLFTLIPAIAAQPDDDPVVHFLPRQCPELSKVSLSDGRVIVLPEHCAIDEDWDPISISGHPKTRDDGRWLRERRQILSAAFEWLRQRFVTWNRR
jgi:hypothetical protein